MGRWPGDAGRNRCGAAVAVVEPLCKNDGEKHMAVATKRLTDVEMVNSPMEWPRWPALPMVRRAYGEDQNAEEEAGYLLAQELPGGKAWQTRLYFGLIFAMKPLAQTKFRDFASVEAMLAEYRID
jgi:hypothetical protein